MTILRTPEDRFLSLPDYLFPAHCVDVGDGLRMHYVDEGPRDAGLTETVFMLQGEPTWSFLERKMIAIVAGAESGVH